MKRCGQLRRFCSDKFVLNLIRFLYKKLRVCYNRKNDWGGNTVYEFDY